MVLQFKSLVDDGTTFLLAEKHEAQVLKNILMNTAIVASLYSENERIIYIRIPTTTELSEIHMNEAAQILLNYDHPLDQFMHYETLENIRLRNNHKFNKFSLKNLHQLPRKNSDYFEALQETKTVCVLNSKFTYKNGQREFDMDLVDESESQYESENQEPSAKKPKEGTSDETNTVENEDFQNSSCHQETSENHETPTSCETTDNQQGKECPVEQSATEAPIEEPESGSDDIEIDVVGIDYNEFNDVGDNDPILNVLENKKLGFDKNSLSRKERKLIDLGKAVQNLQIRGRDHTLRGRSVRDNGVWILQECLKKAKQLKQDLGDAASGTVFDNPTTFVEEMTGVCSSTLKKVGKKDFVEKKKETVKTASRKARWKRRAGRIPEFIKEAIRDHLDECWEKNTHVTVNTLLDWAKDILHLQLGRTFFADALHGMGLTYKKKSATPLIEERIDLVIARRKYLHRKYELLNPISGKQAFFGYLDETWFFEGMTTLKGWQTGNTNLYKMAREIRVEERRSGPRKGKDKGRRAIVLAVLTSEGILEDSANILISGLKENDQFMDYHREMNFDSYSEYMDVIIPKLAEEARKRGMVAVLVIDNAPYHCEVIEKIPTKSSSKKVLMDFFAR
ncbi:unnamed protein product [Caenorhabditis angaria]|uniref:Uncharacterized protein n=1 Tax=Caenorhabditis angaria TaxID=860376 RepID=A0A9P1I1N0_9PELO|nr:unnamed protein product [Caenorhabditis angaria]